MIHAMRIESTSMAMAIAATQSSVADGSVTDDGVTDEGVTDDGSTDGGIAEEAAAVGRGSTAMVGAAD